MLRTLISNISCWGIREWAAAAGVLGFILSLWLAISKLWTNRLQMKLEKIDFIAFDKPRLDFILTLTNKTSAPFSLITVKLSVGTCSADISPIVYSYYNSNPGHNKFPVKTVKLSTRFPLRFNSYESCNVYCSIDDLQTIKLLQNTLPFKVCNRKRYSRFLCHHIRKLCARQPQIEITFHTSRGRRVITPCGEVALHDKIWMESYAVRIAAHEEKIDFPQRGQ